MIGIRSAFSIRARGHRPHLEAVYMTAPRSVCRNTKKALPTGGRPYMTGKTKHGNNRNGFEQPTEPDPPSADETGGRQHAVARFDRAGAKSGAAGQGIGAH